MDISAAVMVIRNIVRSRDRNGNTYHAIECTILNGKERSTFQARDGQTCNATWILRKMATWQSEGTSHINWNKVYETTETLPAREFDALAKSFGYFNEDSFMKFAAGMKEGE